MKEDPEVPWEKLFKSLRSVLLASVVIPNANRNGFYIMYNNKQNKKIH